MNGRGVGWHERVEFAKPVSDGSTVKARNNLTSIAVRSTAFLSKARH
jgi:hypothetical protein